MKQCKYELILEENGRIIKTISSGENKEKTYEMYESMKTEVKHGQKLCIYNPHLVIYYYGIIGAPLDKWELKRIETLKNEGRAKALNGDYSLLLRGLIIETEENGKTYVSLKPENQ